MTEGQKYFIENYLKIRQPDGSFEPITLRPHQLAYLEFLEECKAAGRVPVVIKGKYRTGFMLIDKLWSEMHKAPNDEECDATGAK